MPSSWGAFVFRYLRPPVPTVVVGSAAGVGAAALLVPARDWLGNTNVALLLVVVVVAAAGTGGRLAGAVTAAVTSQAFNVLHTEPYGELFIEKREDVVTTVLVAVVGVAVGELALLRRRSLRRVRRRDYGVQRIHRVSVLAGRGPTFDELLEAVSTELEAELELDTVTYGSGPVPPGPRLGSNGAVVNPSEPSPHRVGRSGVYIALGPIGAEDGWLRLVPRRPRDYEAASLQIAIVLANMLGHVSAGAVSPRSEVSEP